MNNVFWRVARSKKLQNGLSGNSSTLKGRLPIANIRVDHDLSHGRKLFGLSGASIFCPTSKMSHDTVRRAACITTIHIRWFHFEIPSEARGVTDGGVGSGALLGLFCMERNRC